MPATRQCRLKCQGIAEHCWVFHVGKAGFCDVISCGTMVQDLETLSTRFRIAAEQETDPQIRQRLWEAADAEQSLADRFRGKIYDRLPVGELIHPYEHPLVRIDPYRQVIIVKG